jgi:hypothetical protein
MQHRDSWSGGSGLLGGTPLATFRKSRSAQRNSNSLGRKTARFDSADLFSGTNPIRSKQNGGTPAGIRRADRGGVGRVRLWRGRDRGLKAAQGGLTAAQSRASNPEFEQSAASSQICSRRPCDPSPLLCRNGGHPMIVVVNFSSYAKARLG